MRSGAFVAGLTLLLAAAPAAAASVLVFSFDERSGSSLARALVHEGGEAHAVTSPDASLSGAALASYVELLVEELAPDFVVIVTRPQGRGKRSSLVVASDSAKLVTTLEPGKNALASSWRARVAARSILASIDYFNKTEGYERAKNPLLQVSSAYNAFAVPPDAPYVSP